MKHNGLEELSPFQLKDQLIQLAKDQTASKAATHKFTQLSRAYVDEIERRFI